MSTKKFEDFLKVQNSNYINSNGIKLRNSPSALDGPTAGETLTPAPTVTPSATPSEPTSAPSAPVTGTSTTPTISATQPKKTYEQWVSDNGYDVDKDYADAQNDLEYDYMKSMANYGERAEQLAQMGLTSSGVSDVFQLGAFQSYLQNQNDLRRALVEQKKEYSKQYNLYSEAYDAQIKAQEERKQATIGSLYGSAYEMMAAGATADEIRDYMVNSGANSDYVNEAMNRLSGQEETLRNQFISAGVKAAQNIFMKEVEDDDGNKSTVNTFTGSNADIEAIRQYFRGTAYEKDTEQIINQLQDEKKASDIALYEDIFKQGKTDIENGNVIYSVNQLVSLYQQAPDRVRRGKINNLTVRQISKICNDQTAFNNAYAFVGVDKATWDNYDDGDKMLNVLSAIGEINKAGLISDEHTQEYFNQWAENQIATIEINEDLIAFEEQVEDFSNKGYISNGDKLINEAKQKLQEFDNTETTAGGAVADFIDGFFISPSERTTKNNSQSQKKSKAPIESATFKQEPVGDLFNKYANPTVKGTGKKSYVPTPGMN